MEPTNQTQSGATPQGGAELLPAASCSAFVSVQIDRVEVIDMLRTTTLGMNKRIEFNVQHAQWDLLAQGLDALEKDIAKARRLLAALSPNNKLTDTRERDLT